MIPLIFDPIYSQLDLPERHRFPIDKYRTLRDLLLSLGAAPTQFLRPKALRPETLGGALCADYIGRFVRGELDRQTMRRIGFPWSEQLVKRTFTAVGAPSLRVCCRWSAGGRLI